MNKEIVISIIIIILVVFFNYLTEEYTINVVENINNSLNELKDELLLENLKKEELKQISLNIMNNWKEKYEILAYYIEHDELEKVETELTTLSSSIETEEYENCIESIDKCIFILSHIKNKYSLEIKNIF